jgi:hypothetical protein
MECARSVAGVSKLSPSPSSDSERLLGQKLIFEDDYDDAGLDSNFPCDRPWFVNPEDTKESETGVLHLTASSMFMPCQEGVSGSSGVFGRVVDGEILLM